MKTIICVVVATILVVANQVVNAQQQPPIIRDAIPIPQTQEHSGGELQIVYCDTNPTRKEVKENRRFLRPLIIAEPYDAADVLDNNKIRYNMDYMLNDFGAIVDSIRRFYDIIYLNYNDGVDSIFRNAKLLEEAIEIVNARKIPPRSPEAVNSADSSAAGCASVGLWG